MSSSAPDALTGRVNQVLYKRGVRVSDVARILGSSLQVASDRTRGRSRWQGHELFLLAVGLGIDVDEFTPERELAS